MTEDTRLSIRSRAFLKQVWALTRPYWSSEEKWIARSMLAAVVALNLGLVYMTVLLNKWYNAFYNSIQNRDFPEFKHQLWLFLALALIYILIAVVQLGVNMMLQIRWRRWITNVYFGEWLRDNVFYRLELKNYGTDNPDQRMQEDLKIFTTSTLSLGLDLMRSVVSLFSFVFILWGLSGPLSFALGGQQITIPGYMVWVAVVYALLGSWLAHRIGRPLIGLNFFQQKYEADLRFALVRMRENAEGIALYGGHEDERGNLVSRFKQISQNWAALMRSRLNLLGYSSTYSQLATVFPLVVAAPRYFSGAIQLGDLMQISSAFGRVQDALSWFVDSYSSLAEYKATCDRLITFHHSISKAGEEARAGGISVTSDSAGNIAARQLRVALPDGRVLLRDIETVFTPGENTLVTGPSGSGKSTLFRALSGIWPFGSGTVELPADAKVMFLPQKPYLPLGTLREVVSYPSTISGHDDAAIAEVLRLCRLEHLIERLNDSDNWSMRLSPGEQQRLAVARALLNRPQWLFLDEATAALDADTEGYLYRLLRERLPQTTLISIAHRTHVAEHHQRRMTLVPGEDGARFEVAPISAG
jgi:vitamin B12/bleomycin/antimicrobial peptide transport system ATP-binding/permease protein